MEIPFAKEKRLQSKVERVQSQKKRSSLHKHKAEQLLNFDEQGYIETEDNILRLSQEQIKSEVQVVNAQNVLE